MDVLRSAENHPRLVDRWARLRRCGETRATFYAASVIHSSLRVRCSPRGCACPAIAADGESRANRGLWLRKPLRSGGGSQIARYEPQASRDATTDDYYLQQFVEGVACSAVFVAARGRAELLGVTRQLIGTPWLGASGFRYCGSLGPVALAPAELQTLRFIGNVLSEKFELVGLFGVDAVINSDGVWPIEINPRYTASIEILERAYGLQAVELHVRACDEGVLPTVSPRPPQRQHGKAILFAPRNISIPPAWLPSAEPAADLLPAAADIPAPLSTIETGWPILTVFAEGHSRRQVVARLQAETARIARELGCAGAIEDFLGDPS